MPASPLFQDMGPEETRLARSYFQPLTYPKGKAIFHQGDLGQALYLVEEGRVRLYRTHLGGQEKILGFLGPGEVFGEMSLLDGGERSASALAEEETLLLALYREAYLGLIRRLPLFAHNLARILAHRLRALAGRGGEVLIDTRLMDDVVRVEEPPGPLELLVVAAQGRAAIAGDVAGGVEPFGEVAATLLERQPDQRLDAGHEHLPTLEQVLVVQGDVTQLAHRLAPFGSSAGRPLRRTGAAAQAAGTCAVALTRAPVSSTQVTCSSTGTSTPTKKRR